MGTPMEGKPDVAKRRLNGWAGYYLRFLLHTCVKDPIFFLKRFVIWNVYVFLPGLTRRSYSPPVFRCSDVEAAVNAFRRDGFVILSDALAPGDVDKLRRIVDQKAEDIVRRHAEGLLAEDLMHGSSRYSFGEYGHNPEWEYLGHNPTVLGVLGGIWEGHGYRAVAAGGDFVLPGGAWQPLHSDMGWKAAGEECPES